MSINNDVYMVSFPTPNYEAPNLKKFLSNKDILKIFHFARFDMLAIYSYLGIMVENVICTKILSKLARTYSDKHSLAALCKEVLGIELNKSACSSYWGNSELTNDQVKYAAADVKYLHSIFQYLHNILLEEKKWQLAQEVLHTLKTLVLLDHNLYDPFVILNH
jgi:ribonuclease D